MNTTWSPENVIKPKYLKDYKNEIDGLWHEVVLLNSNLFILEKLMEFPFKLFFHERELHFWNLTISSFFESCIMVVWRLVIETRRKKILSLNLLVNRINDRYINN